MPLGGKNQAVTAPRRNLLIVEDDERSARLLETVLSQLGAKTHVARTGPAALDQLAENDFDLITLDIGLPGMSGVDLLQHIRELTTTPVIMVTAADQMSTLVEALAAGADDYIVKPFRPKELIARAEAVLRRSGSPSDDDDSQERFADDTILIDLSRNTVVTQAGTSTLTGTERRLLAYLLRNRNRVVTQDELLRSVWGAGYESAAANLHVFIGYLRRKIELEPRNPTYILTHRGVGYEFVTERR